MKYQDNYENLLGIQVRSPKLGYGLVAQISARHMYVILLKRKDVNFFFFYSGDE